MSEFFHYIVVGLGFGFGFAGGYALFNGLLSLIGRAPAKPVQ